MAVSARHGTSATELQPIAFSATIRRVRIDATPKTSRRPRCNDAVTLWKHPDYLFADERRPRRQLHAHSPKHLSEALRSPGVTLTNAAQIPLRHRWAIAIHDTQLRARYLARPLDSDPLQLRLSGSWTILRLRAPAQRQPDVGTARLTVKHLGRELNGGSPVFEPDAPASGLRVGGISGSPRRCRFCRLRVAALAVCFRS